MLFDENVYQLLIRIQICIFSKLNIMKLLFIQGGSRLKQSEDGRWFTDSNFTKEVWQRYMDLCDEFVIILRQEKIYILLLMQHVSLIQYQLVTK